MDTPKVWMAPGKCKFVDLSITITLILESQYFKTGFESKLSNSRLIYGLWLIEKISGRNLISRNYVGINIDIDLFAPLLTSTKMFVDATASEPLEMVDTEGSRYIWHSNQWLIIVLMISKKARIGHMRFLLHYALTVFMEKCMKKYGPIEEFLQNWQGQPIFERYERFVDELVEQYEQTDEALLAGKAMDCLEVYSHLFNAILTIDLSKEKKQEMMERIKSELHELVATDEAFKNTVITNRGIDILSVDYTKCSYRSLRTTLDKMLTIVARVTRNIAPKTAYRDMLFDHVVPYLKKDMARLETYSIIDDVIQTVF